MKTKTIKSIIHNKFNNWVDSIDDKSVRDLVNKNTIITGGCITSMLLNEDVNDFDVYFTDKQTCKAVATYYCNKYKKYDLSVVESGNRIKVIQKDNDSLGKELLDTTIFDEDAEAPDTTKPDNKYEPKYISSNAITLSDKIQIVLRFYGDADDIHSNFDFIHCMNSWESLSNKLTLKPEALECTLTKELRYNGSKYPLASIIRTRKFIKRGWTVNAGQYLKMCLQLQEFDLTDYTVLSEQLTGVDQSYFSRIIEKLKEAKMINEKIEINFLIGLIDELF